MTVLIAGGGIAGLSLALTCHEIGVRTRDYGMHTKRGLHIWTEPRGTWAG